MSLRRSKYAAKKERQKTGSYHGTSPFFQNIPEFQYLRPLVSYPHLRGMRPELRGIKTRRDNPIRQRA